MIFTYYATLVVCLIICIFFYFRFRRFSNRVIMYSSYKDIDVIVSRCKDLSYSNVLVKHLASEILNKTRLNDSQLKQIGREYIKDLIKLVGPSIYKDLSKIYGNEESLIFNWLTEFTIKVLSEEVTRYDKTIKDSFSLQEEG